VSELAAEEVQTFAASAHTVWQYRLDFTNLPAYNAAVRQIARVTDGQGAGGDAGVGAVYQMTLETEAGAHPVTMHVTKVIEDAVVEADMLGAMTANETFSVAPGPDGAGCVVTLCLWLDLPAGVSAETAARLLEGGRQQIRVELDGMRRELDGPAATG
jgi:hypothetical protein